MTIKEHIAFCKTVLNRIRNEYPEAINPILEEMSQWQRVDTLVTAVQNKYPKIKADCLGMEVDAYQMDGHDPLQRSIVEALSVLEKNHDIEPARPSKLELCDAAGITGEEFDAIADAAGVEVLPNERGNLIP